MVLWSVGGGVSDETIVGFDQGQCLATSRLSITGCIYVACDSYWVRLAAGSLGLFGASRFGGWGAEEPGAVRGRDL